MRVGRRWKRKQRGWGEGGERSTTERVEEREGGFTESVKQERK